MPSLESQAVTLGYENNIIIRDLDLAIPEGKITVLVGANGCGKSTLLRALARLLKPLDGEIFLGDSPIARMAGSDIAKKLSILPQGPDAPEELTVYQLIRQGRYPYQKWLRGWSAEDEAMVEQAMQATGLGDLRHRPLQKLSGGQRQRAWIALTLAQNTDIILLDEPTTYLDMSHQVDILELLHSQNRKAGKTIVMVLHDLYLASRYADHLITLRDGKIYAQGTPQDIVTTDLVRAVFDLECQIFQDPLTGTPICIPLGHIQNARPEHNVQDGQDTAHDAP
ncbi:ABC transporter ATP-binding protein [Thalassospira marina]|uniref:Cobalamin/Fe(3+)-siderophore ABC transporter ATP-binding protein n=1 Tax=Thalassospira marina TaxID=2048283 RepID=A0ABM6QH61_9PROT|nr:ABC transporter ATP-binding protein [Thalassospira marina]AUG55980.1 cobalamin/Fe(3+)-siderophore ABC transporter ATP-binding protein [Thalassospira marina]